MQEALSALNGLAGAVAGTDLRPGSVSEKVRLSRAQESAYRRLRRRISRYADADVDLQPRGALQELLKTGNIYDTDAPKTTAPYDAEKLRVLKGDIEPRDIVDVAPPEIGEMFRNSRDFIERSDLELSEEPPLVDPYWDPALDPKKPENRERLMEFLRRLAGAGLLGGRKRRKADIGFFMVPKKGDLLRLIVDARQANALHRLPPSTRLASVERLLGVSVHPLVVGPDLEAESSEDDSPNADAEPVVGGSVGLQDGFYQFRNEWMASFFCVPLRVQAWELGLTQIFDEETGDYVPVASDEWIWPAFIGMAMGWSWGLHVCHQTLCHVLESTSRDGDALLLDHCDAPVLRPGCTVGAPYVDNANVLGCRQDGSVRARLQRITAEFDRLGLRWHEYNDESVVFEMLGVIVSGKEHAVYHKPRRLWRLYLGVQEVLRLGKLSAHGMHVLLGHFVHVFMLNRPAISVFRKCYDFITEFYDSREPVVLSSAVLDELTVAKGLIFLGEGNLARTSAPVAFTTDASLKGYALFASPVETKEVFGLTKRKERSRFKKVEITHFDPDDRCLGELADPLLPVPEPLPALRRPGKRALRPLQVVDSGCPLAPLPQSFLEPSRWHLIVAGAWRDSGVIHEFEARTAVMGLRRAARDPSCHGTVVLSAGDNMSAVMAFEKGRAVSYELLAQCRRAAAIQISCEIDWRQRHVRTAENVADHASRMADRGELFPGDFRRGPFSSLIAHKTTTPAASPSTSIPCAVPCIPSTSVAPSATRTAPPSSSFPITSASASSLSPSQSWDRSARCRGQRSGDGALEKSKSVRFWGRAHGRVAPCDRAELKDLSGLAETADLLNSRDVQTKKQKQLFFFEIFSGEGFLSGAVLESGLFVLPPIDIRLGSQCDLSKRRVQSHIIGWLRSGRIWCVHLGTPCTRWTTARTTGRKEPQNSLTLAVFTARVLRTCRQCGIKVSLENPSTSKLFSWPPIARELQLLQCQHVVTHQCQWGVPYRKATKFATDIETLSVLSNECRCGKHSVVLEGVIQLPGRPPQWRTSLAACYPPRLCRRYGAAIGAMAPSGAWRGAASAGSNVGTHFWNSLAAAAGVDRCELPELRCPARPFPWWRIGVNCWQYRRHAARLQRSGGATSQASTGPGRREAGGR